MAISATGVRHQLLDCGHCFPSLTPFGSELADREERPTQNKGNWGFTYTSKPGYPQIARRLKAISAGKRNRNCTCPNINSTQLQDHSCRYFLFQSVNPGQLALSVAIGQLDIPYSQKPKIVWFTTSFLQPRPQLVTT